MKITVLIMIAQHFISYLKNDRATNILKHLYLDIDSAKERYIDCINQFTATYGNEHELSIFSAPGRTEIGGNHTDHQYGCVLAGAVNLDVIAVVSPNDDNVIRVCSKEHGTHTVSLNELNPIESENNTSSALIRGIVAKIIELGYVVSGFDAYTSSNVLCGSGLSSSAAFEVLICTIINHLDCNQALSSITLAQISQYAENVYFGKPCGLMDQTACAVGGIVAIDFEDPQNPIVENIPFELNQHGYKLIITNTGANHADLTDDYASVPADMKFIAHYFNKQVLREVDENAFMQNIKNLRSTTNDRAILRAMHFFGDNKRVARQVAALKENDMITFFKEVNESGNSSCDYLQNIYSCTNAQEQGISLALCLTKSFLNGRGACRVHGGGFAGTIQAYVPEDMIYAYVSMMEQVFDKNSCYVLSIRNEGGIKIL